MSVGIDSDRSMVEPPTSAYHLHPDSLGMANTTEDRKIIAALAQARHPATGEPLTEKTALSVLHHPRVRRALARLGHETSDEVVTHAPPDAQPAGRSRRRTSLLVRIGVPLVVIWCGVIAWFAFDRKLSRPPLDDPTLFFGLNWTPKQAFDGRMRQLYEALENFGERHLPYLPDPIPDRFDSLTMTSPDRLLPLLNTSSFALLRLDEPIAGRLKRTGLNSLLVLDPAADDSTDCNAVDSWTWPLREYMNRGRTANLYHSRAVGGCGRPLPLQGGITVAVWAGDTAAVTDNLADTDIVTVQPEQAADRTERWLDPANTPDGTKVFLAVGLGSDCTLFKNQGKEGGKPLSTPTDTTRKRYHYSRYIALYHIANVEGGQLVAEEQIRLKRIVGADGRIQPGKAAGGRSLI